VFLASADADSDYVMILTNLMKLREALEILNAPLANAVPPYCVHLVTGFEALHLKTFLGARIRGLLAAQVGDRPVDVCVGLFGDLDGNWRLAITGAGTAPIVTIIEWGDLHPALGWREASFPASWNKDNVVAEVTARLRNWLELLRSRGERRQVLALLALPVAPWATHGLYGQSPNLELELRAMLAQFARDVALCGVRVVAPSATAAWDPAKDLSTGFPYTLEFADELAERIAALVLPPVPKKGLITDLDHTLWQGVVGDDGPAGVSWDIDHKARVHGWWQQFLASLARQGSFVGIASKNDREPVEAALARHDLLIPRENIFPMEIHWSDKAESIRRIAAAWNVGLDSLVFVDDSPLELELVRQSLPQVECLLFPKDDPSALASMLMSLRKLFAKESVSSDDLLRVASVRQRESLEQADMPSNGSVRSEEHFAALGSCLRLDCRRPPQARALELINKTNQFNLNGQRWDESSWLEWCHRPEARLVLVGYEDRFGPLGNIAVLAAEYAGDDLRVRSWVMSCRAFSRRIEFATLHFLLERWPCKRVLFDWRRTERNGPTFDVLRQLFDNLPSPGVLEIEPDALRERLPPQYAAIKELLENE
jgi:FkbH-like protein